MDTIVQGKETNLGSDVTFDGKQFVMSGKAYTGWTGAGSSFATNGVGWLMDQGIESAKTAETTSAVAQMNGYINTMIPVWETMGMTPEQGLAQAFSVENFNSMEFKGTLFQQMGTAVRNWITGTEVDPKTGKVVPPKEDASKQESKAKSGDVLSADEYLQSVSNKPIEHVQGLDDTFAVNLAGMLQAAPPEIKAGLGVYSGYRSIERQKELFAAAVKKYGSEEAARKWVAPPGRSNHNHGKAADLSWNGESLKNAPAWVVKWVHQNAGTYGLNFPLNNENWHIEPIGIRGKKKTQMASK